LKADKIDEPSCPFGVFFSSWGNFGGGAGSDFAGDNLPFLRK
jgi:hypothetical protein